MTFPEWADSPGEALSVLSLIGVLLSALAWLIRAQVRAMSELKPNHGSSLRDAVDRLEATASQSAEDIRELRAVVAHQVDRLLTAVERTHSRIDDHIRDHLTEGKK